MNTTELFNKAYSKLYPEYPPNYPIPLAWEKTKTIPVKKILKKWKQSNYRHIDKAHVIYVHIPYCSSICKFCGFYREKLKKANEIDYFLEKLKKESNFLKESFTKTKIKWLCIGGGTPSLLNEKQINKLFQNLRENFNLKNTKTAFEAMPSTLSLNKLKLLKENGVYFLAIGVQTFNEKLLRNLNRFQTQKQVISSIENARKVGIKNIEIDLIIGLPGQTEEMFFKDIEIVSKLDVERVYIFDFQPRFFTNAENKSPSLSAITLEKWRNIRARGIEILLKNGYQMRCGRWVYKREGEAWPYSYDQQEDEIYSIAGLGPSAISYCMDGMRYQNVSDIKKYFELIDQKKLPIEKIRFLSQKDEMKNMFVTKIMHTGKIEANLFKERFNKNIFKYFQKEIKILSKNKLILKTPDSLISTNRAKLQNALNILFYSNSDLKKIAINLEIPTREIKKEKILSDKSLEYNNKLINLSANKKENISFIAIKKKLGYKELVFTFSKCSLKLFKFYYIFAQKNGFEISLVLPSYKHTSFINGFYFKKIYLYLENINSLKSNTKGNYSFILPYSLLDKIIFLPTNLPENIEIIFAKNLFKPEQEKVDYKKIRTILPEILKTSKERNLKIFLNEIPYCIIYPHLNLFHSFKDFKLGDKRESELANIKLPQCLDCKYLLKCPGPAPVSIINNEKEIKPIL